MRSRTLTNTGAVARRNREQLNDGGDSGHHLESPGSPLDPADLSLLKFS